MLNVMQRGSSRTLMLVFRAGGHHRRVEDVELVVDVIGDPDFPFVRGERDPVTWTLVGGGYGDWVFRHLHSADNFSGPQVADFKSEQVVYVGKDEPAPLTVKGRTASVNGPTVRTTVWALASATAR
jgi:hypothetical protein